MAHSLQHWRRLNRFTGCGTSKRLIWLMDCYYWKVEVTLSWSLVKCKKLGFVRLQCFKKFGGAPCTFGVQRSIRCLRSVSSAVERTFHGLRATVAAVGGVIEPDQYRIEGAEPGRLNTVVKIRDGEGSSESGAK
jgi:hypothetical protein